MFSLNKLLSTTLAAYLSFTSVSECFGKAVNTDSKEKDKIQEVAKPPLTKLDLSKITFNDNISFLTKQEQDNYHRCQAEYQELLSHLSPSRQKKEKAIYKWIPDVIKIIASRDYQDRKEFERHLEVCANLEQVLERNKYKIPYTIKPRTILITCMDMIQYRYPTRIINTQEFSIEETAKKCGFDNLSRMIDFCDDPENEGKSYKNCTNKKTYASTLDEMNVFIDGIGRMYESAVWLDFRTHPFCAVYPFWRFDLKKVDTSNLSPDEYAKMEKQLKCIPPEILINCHYSSYGLRKIPYTRFQKADKIVMESPEYIKKYAKGKGISLSNKEASEVSQLATQLLKYGIPLKLLKEDENMDMKETAKKFGFFRVAGFVGYYRMKKANHTTIQFYQSAPNDIPKFIKEAKDFYALAAVINFEKTQQLYQDIKDDTKITIQHHDYNISNSIIAQDSTRIRN